MEKRLCVDKTGPVADFDATAGRAVTSIYVCLYWEVCHHVEMYYSVK